MKIKNLPENTNLVDIKIKLTPFLLKKYTDYTYKGNGEVYIVGPTMGDFFISNLPKETKGRRELFPMPISVQPCDLLECEILEK